jgi:hypothetical protein
MRIFKEEQRFTQKWLLVVLTITSTAPIAIITNKMLKSARGIQWDVYLGIVSLILFGTFCVFLFKLKTRIDEIRIHYKFIPFHFSTKTIVWNDIEKCYTQKYDAII